MKSTETNDRELLELAAKAGGYRVKFSVTGDPYAQAGINTRAWNPLTDDGDSLGLAVDLNIGIRSHGHDHWQQPNTSVALYEVGEFGGGRVTVEHGGDSLRATRRAIVRAAAQVGQAAQGGAQ